MRAWRLTPILTGVVVIVSLMGCSANSTTEVDSPSATVESTAPATPAVSVQEPKAPDCTKERKQLDKYEVQILSIKATVDEIGRQADQIMAKENVTESDQAKLYKLGDRVKAYTQQLEMVGAKRDALRRVMENKGCSMY